MYTLLNLRLQTTIPKLGILKTPDSVPATPGAIERCYVGLIKRRFLSLFRAYLVVRMIDDPPK